MRNEALEKLDGLVGEWKLTMSDAWFLEPPGTEVHGSATIEWLGEAFIVMKWELDGEATWLIGRSDANDAYKVLTHDDRGVCRLFEMTWEEGRWTMSREDPDFHQRVVIEVEPDRLLARPEASEDEGKTWRKDFDLLFVRR